MQSPLLGLLLTGVLSFAPVPFAKPDQKEIVEDFSRSMVPITKAYGRFVYETTVAGARASVTNKTLCLHGDHEEGDQRLSITAQSVIGQREWPRSLAVVVKLAGTQKDNVGWHVGVSVGKVKILFHPDYPGGAFRAETTDTHIEFFSNDNMGFTPAANVIHEMTIKMQRTNQGVRFDVTFVEGNKGGNRYRKSFELTHKQVGLLDRVGLERSGRRGGDALFTSISIKPGK